MKFVFLLSPIVTCTPKVIVQAPHNSTPLFISAIALMAFLILLVVIILGIAGAVAFRRYYINHRADKTLCYFLTRPSYSANSSMNLETTDIFSLDAKYTSNSLAQLATDRCISRGRYSQVRVVTRSDRTVALKIYRPKHERFWLAELKVYNTAQLMHSNILQFIAGGSCTLDGQDSLYLVTEYHSNGSLLDFLSHSTVSLTTMLHMGASFASGLAHLHHESLDVGSKSPETRSKPVLAHCNISSSNILVKADLTCCIADFKRAVVKDTIMSSAVKLLKSRILYGSTRYSAPEVLDGDMKHRKCDFESLKQADIYAVGLVLWEMTRRCTASNGEKDRYM